jgi:elongator complex protein 2
LPGQIPLYNFGFNLKRLSVPLTFERFPNPTLFKFVHSATLAGHEDWIRCLAFKPASDGEPLVLASGSQDATIRLWSIEAWRRVTSSSAASTSTIGELSDELLDVFEASLGELGDADEGGKQISLKRHILSTKSGSGR